MGLVKHKGRAYRQTYCMYFMESPYMHFRGVLFQWQNIGNYWELLIDYRSKNNFSFWTTTCWILIKSANVFYYGQELTQELCIEDTTGAQLIQDRSLFKYWQIIDGSGKLSADKLSTTGYFSVRAFVYGTSGCDV